MTDPEAPSPIELWRLAGGGTPAYSRERYLDLMVEHGYLVPGPPEPLPCGWPGPRREDYDPDEPEGAQP